MTGRTEEQLVNIRDVVNFYGASVTELQEEFRNSMAAYLDVCREEGIEPDKPFSGRFNLRLPPELHRAIADASALEGKSLNGWVMDVLAEAPRTFVRVDNAVRPARRTGTAAGRPTRRRIPPCWTC